MKFLKSILMLIGVFSVISTLIFAVQSDPQWVKDLPRLEEKETTIKNVADGYRITPIEIPVDLNFAGEKVPQNDPEIMERVDREFLVNTYWQSNALLLIKRANQYFPIIEPILAKNGIPDDLVLTFTPPAMGSVLVDSLAPIVTLTTPANASYINSATDSATFAVSGTCSENGQTVVIEVDTVQLLASLKVMEYVFGAKLLK